MRVHKMTYDSCKSKETNEWGAWAGGRVGGWGGGGGIVVNSSLLSPQWKKIRANSESKHSFRGRSITGVYLLWLLEPVVVII